MGIALPGGLEGFLLLMIPSFWHNHEASPKAEMRAFNQAMLRSERFRVYSLMILVSCVLALATLRARYSSLDDSGLWLRKLYTVVGAYLLFDVGRLYLVRRAEKYNCGIPTWSSLASIFIESAMVTYSIYGLTQYQSVVGPYRALLASAVLVYFLFIILSTLRLNPWLCAWAGFTSAGGYFFMYQYTLRHFPDNQYASVAPAATYYMHTAMLLLGGVFAALVSQRIRMHVIAALHEAETQQKLATIEHDLQTARAIQMGLLPKTPPVVEGYDIAGWSQPAAQTGGDYFDWMVLPGGNVIITVADATGHGIGPALLVAACRAYFRALATRQDPLECLTAQVDELLANDVPEGRFITAVVALLQPERNEISMYSAGHGPLYLVRASGSAPEVFDADQLPLGIGAGSNGENRARVLALQPGDMLALVTDGFFECASPGGELLGTDRLGAALSANRQLRAEALIQQLHHNVVHFAQGHPQEDDMTAVIIKREH